ncbi:MAG: hypothetical protein MJE77_12120 [Proteobacteria bacterium]|nr:hypothetical protein [Pseudomonadota bacterium]
MRNSRTVSKLLIPLTLAALLPAGQRTAAQSSSGAGGSVDADRLESAVGQPDEERASQTYGEFLTEMAKRAAFRAAGNRGSDHVMEAISDLAARWLEMPGGATRVWDQYPRSPQSVQKAVRNAQRSLMRKERRHERIAAAAPGPGAVEPTQQSAAELQELLQAVDARDREILLSSAQGMNAREIGERHGISHAAARQRLLRARKQLPRTA